MILLVLEKKSKILYNFKISYQPVMLMCSCQPKHSSHFSLVLGLIYVHSNDFTVPVVVQVMEHQNSGRAVGSVPASGGSQGWILIHHLLHLVLPGLDETGLPSAAAKTQTQ